MSDSTRKWAIIGIIVAVAVTVPGYFLVGDTIVQPPPTPLKAVITPITAGPYYVGNSIEFSARSSTFDSTITDYHWDFDGEKKTGVVVEHVFQSEGKHKISLTIKDSKTNSNKDETFVNVSERPPIPPSDIDNDGVEDSKDNCPSVKNPDQKDTNNNGKGDACDDPVISDPNPEPTSVDIIKFKHLMTIPDPGLSGSKSYVGMFNRPVDVAVDSKGNLYVSDYVNNRIQKFDRDGTFINTWGGTGKGNGQFAGTAGIFIDKNDIIYVGESPGNRIQLFDENGKYLKTFPPSNMPENKSYTLYRPYNIAMDSNNFIYITDEYNGRIVKLDSEGQFVKSWVATESGTEFKNVKGIAIDSKDNVYVADQGNHRLIKFDTEGKFVDTWGGHGYGDKQFAGPHGIAIDEHDTIYVAEYAGHRVSMLKSDGTWLGSISSFENRGSKSGQFVQPFGVAVHDDKVYVSEYENHRVQIFTQSLASP